MPAKGNQQVPNVHFHKDWQSRVKTWFNQPMKKKRRHQKRIVKAARIAPRPLNRLQPVIRCPTYRHNIRERLGRGFTSDELKAAGLHPKFAQTIGIACDRRRRNKSMESLQQNIQRLKEYQSKLILFPRKKGKAPAKNESTPEEIAKATQFLGKMQPIKPVSKEVEVVAITADLKEFQAFQAIRQARAIKRLHGYRIKKAADAEADALSTKK
jgi:large subunit ribosomal protein L13e